MTKSHCHRRRWASPPLSFSSSSSSSPSSSSSASATPLINSSLLFSPPVLPHDFVALARGSYRCRVAYEAATYRIRKAAAASASDSLHAMQCLLAHPPHGRRLIKVISRLCSGSPSSSWVFNGRPFVHRALAPSVHPLVVFVFTPPRQTNTHRPGQRYTLALFRLVHSVCIAPGVRLRRRRLCGSSISRQELKADSSAASDADSCRSRRIRRIRFAHRTNRMSSSSDTWQISDVHTIQDQLRVLAPPACVGTDVEVERCRFQLRLFA